ncbi:MAG: hypothetical protein IPG59_10360 [Candidatus Melainabacteria bacterium]|nr:MAG: hypothetical protein IPG59_10360 [Candidatus Melainabacteria bacterium]
MTKRSYCLFILCCLSLSPLASPLDVMAQNRQKRGPALPKAQFQTRSPRYLPDGRQGAAGYGSQITTPGLHLTGGENRTKATAAKPYNPGEPTLRMALVRWTADKMPLRVWISPGIELPKLPFAQLQQQRVDEVFQRLQSEDPFGDCNVAKGWEEQTNYQVAAGIEQWRQFEHEGLIKFGFTEDPREAQVLVFFTDSFPDSGGPGGLNVGGNTCAQLFTPAQTQLPNYRQKPVVIELSTMINHTPERMIGATAHEFGHALGIKEHSPYRDDIMYVDRIVTSLSAGDKATFRLLYKTKPQYVM